MYRFARLRRAEQELQAGALDLEKARRGGGRGGEPLTKGRQNLFLQQAVRETGVPLDQFFDGEKLTFKGQTFIEAVDSGMDIKQAVGFAEGQTGEQLAEDLNAQKAQILGREDLDEATKQQQVAPIQRQLDAIEGKEQREGLKALERQRTQAEEALKPENFSAVIPNIARETSAAFGSVEGVRTALDVLEDKIERGNLTDEQKIQTYDAIVTPIAESQGIRSLDNRIAEGGPVTREEIDANPEAYTNALAAAWDKQIFAKLGNEFSHFSINLAIDRMNALGLNVANPVEKKARFLGVGGRTGGFLRVQGTLTMPSRDVIPGLANELSATQGRKVSQKETLAIYRAALLEGYKLQNFERDVNKARDFVLNEENSRVLEANREGREQATQNLLQRFKNIR